MKHRFRLDEDGEELYIWETDFHNGPECTRCGEMFCKHCSPKCFEEECPGDRYQQAGQLSLFGEEVA